MTPDVDTGLFVTKSGGSFSPLICVLSESKLAGNSGNFPDSGEIDWIR